MRLWPVFLISAVAAWLVFYGLVYGTDALFDHERIEYNKCRDGGGAIGFCLTGFK
jgi:hypothetical protein